MTDWVSTEKGRHLSGRQSKDTAPEMALRKALHSRGLRFRLHRSLAKGCNPDLVLPRHRIAIWVDGCWWHGHGHQGTPKAGPNSELWAKKLESNRLRDARAVETAESLGWRAVRIWECELKRDAGEVADRIVSLTFEAG